MTLQPDLADFLDEHLLELLEEDLLAFALTPPRVPAFAALTVRPGAPS